MWPTICTILGAPKISKLTNKEIDKLKKLGKCYNCMRKRHTAACYTKPQRFYSAVSAELQKTTIKNHKKPLIISLFLLPGDLLTDKALVVPCKLGNKGEIKTRSLLDTEAISIRFINEKMAHHVCHMLQISFFFAKLKPLKGFDGKPA